MQGKSMQNSRDEQGVFMCVRRGFRRQLQSSLGCCDVMGVLIPAPVMERSHHACPQALQPISPLLWECPWQDMGHLAKWRALSSMAMWEGEEGCEASVRLHGHRPVRGGTGTWQFSPELVHLPSTKDRWAALEEIQVPCRDAKGTEQDSSDPV